MAVIRTGIRALMSGIDDVEVVGEAATADDAVYLAKALLPTVVLIDEGLPGDGLMATRAIKEALPHTEVVVMTDHLDVEKAARAIEVGATGYILKDIPPKNLAAAIRALANGGTPQGPADPRTLIGRLQLLKLARVRTRLSFDGLTRRELDILSLLAQGSGDREIAHKLIVAEGTVKTHIRNILRKLGVRNRTQAVAHVLRRGLIN
jgi:DNA-binding NarL/FixJ family response regulator